LSARLNTLHNLYFYQQLMSAMRTALAEGRFAEFARPFLLPVCVEKDKEEEQEWQH
jgi:tRNA-guanine family transglycosylase